MATVSSSTSRTGGSATRPVFETGVSSGSLAAGETKELDSASSAATSRGGALPGHREMGDAARAGNGALPRVLPSSGASFSGVTRRPQPRPGCRCAAPPPRPSWRDHAATITRDPACYRPRTKPERCTATLTVTEQTTTTSRYTLTRQMWTFNGDALRPILRGQYRRTIFHITLVNTGR